VSFPRYPRYKPSGVEWLGEVPEHWEVSPLKNVCRFYGGGTPDRESTTFWGGTIPWVSPKDMKCEVITSTEELITQAGVDASAASVLAPGHALLVVRSGILKHTIPVAINHVPFAVNQDIRALRFDTTRCNAQFFMRWVQGLNDRLLLEWSKQGATVESIEHAYLANSSVALPTIPEQIAIATFLDRETAKIDALVAEQERLIELLKEKRQAVISHGVTKGLDPNAAMKDSGVEWLREVPKHWEIVRVGGLFRTAADPGTDDLPILSVSIHDGVSDKEISEDEQDRKVTRSEDRSKYLRVEPGDLVYNMMRAWQGGFGTVATAGMVSPAYIVARPISELPTAFVERVLRTPQAVEEMRRYSRGVTDFRLRLYWDEFKTLSLPVPPAAEVRLMLERILAIEAMHGALANEAEAAIALLRERRAALISAAVTGQIDVRNAVPMEVA
jgi:type I restriction enzyme S subunit